MVCLAAVSPCLAEDAGVKLIDQVTALLKQHDAALSSQNIQAVMQTYVKGPHTFVMGTGPGEIYRGEQGIKGAYSQFFTRYEKGSLRYTYNWVSAGSMGDVAWFAAEGIIKGKVKGEVKELGVNLSGTLQKQKGAWRFIAMHFSRLGVTAEPVKKTSK
jgi:ketosteroid isomerase-like protein